MACSRGGGAKKTPTPVREPAQAGDVAKPNSAAVQRAVAASERKQPARRLQLPLKPGLECSCEGEG